MGQTYINTESFSVRARLRGFFSVVEQNGSEVLMTAVLRNSNGLDFSLYRSVKNSLDIADLRDL
jgi:hypothetical protein